MVHPDYDGQDGALLWHVYYGQFSDDSRFDAFRRKQLLNADVIKPFFTEKELDGLATAKVDRQMLVRKIEDRMEAVQGRWWDNISEDNGHHVTSHSMFIVFSILCVACVYGYWYWTRQFKGKQSLISVDTESSQALLNRNRNLQDNYIEVQ